MSERPTPDGSMESLAATLAAAMSDGVAPLVGLDQYIVFDLDLWQLGARLTHLNGVERLAGALVPTPIPNGPPWLDGIVSLRGEIVSAVDLRTVFGVRRRARLARSAEGLGRLLVAAQDGLNVGLVVDDIRDVVFVTSADIGPVLPAHSLTLFPPAAAPFVTGIFTDPKRERGLALLDLARLITDPRMSDFSLAFS